MAKILIDINCDVGEGIGNESSLFPHISSCSIACGGHAGNAESIKKVIAVSRPFNLKLGAHPSYPDKENFGRLSIRMPRKDLIISIREQLAVFMDILRKERLELHHVKAHGALYNDIASDAGLAKTFLEAVRGINKDTRIYVPYKSEIESIAINKGFKVLREAFGDRNYNDNLSLVSRTEHNAIIGTPEAVLEHILSIVADKKVKTISGNFKDIEAETICIHGDTPDAVQILEYLSGELGKFNISLLR